MKGDKSYFKYFYNSVQYLNSKEKNYYICKKKSIMSIIALIIINLNNFFYLFKKNYCKF